MATPAASTEELGGNGTARVLASASPRASKSLPRMSPWANSTQKGGAVLWYLRKHTPMQRQMTSSSDAEEEEGRWRNQEYPQTGAFGVATQAGTSQAGALHAVADRALKLAAEADAAAVAADPTHGSSGRGSTAIDSDVHRKQQAVGIGPSRPQQEFLHHTLAAIGADLDEEDGRPRGPGTQAMSALQRQQLRQLYSKHVDTKREQLHAAVTAREKEVATLKKQVQQLEQNLVAARAVSAHDTTMRLPVASPSDRNQALGRKKHRTQRKGSGSNSGEPPETTRHNWRLDGDKIYTNDLEESLALQSETGNAVRAELDDKMRRLHSQTIQRKSAEVMLFSLHAQVLRSRAEALRLEGRVSRLADEQRNIYERMPQAMDQQLQRRTAKVRAEHKAQKLVTIKAEHWPELLKLKDLETLAQETKTLEKQISLMEEQRAKADEVLAKGHDPIEASEDHLRRMALAFSAMQRSWAVWTEARLGAASQKTNSVRDGMMEAAVKLTDLQDLMALMGESEEVSMELDDPRHSTAPDDSKLLEVTGEMKPQQPGHTRAQALQEHPTMPRARAMTRVEALEAARSTV